jgi:hypothetical protein
MHSASFCQVNLGKLYRKHLPTSGTLLIPALFQAVGVHSVTITPEG